MADALVELNCVSRLYASRGGQVTALAEASCRVRLGDRIAIMGPSGSGKSTLLALMAGLDEPSSGRIAWPFVSDAERLRPRHIGIAFQTPSLVPALSVVENVEIPLLILDEAEKARDRALAALDAMDLAELALRLPEEISGGQAQRAGIARAIVTEPQLILADEPTGQLDQETGQIIIHRLTEWAEKSGAALLIATHDQTVARQMSSIWYINYGQLNTELHLRAVS